MNMLKTLFAALVLTSAVALVPVAASAEDKMEHKEMNLEKNHMNREQRHHMMRHHGLAGHHHRHHQMVHKMY
jgi:Ni/Co efflux regulator RcnB